MKLLSIFLLSASVFAKESNLRRGLEIFETSQCISLDTEPDAYVKAYLSNSGTTMDELVADCGAGGGCEGEETCCRFHTNAIECDSDNDFNHQPVRATTSNTLSDLNASQSLFAHSHLLLEYTSVCATVLPQTSQQLWLPPQPLLKKGFQDLLLRATTVRSITPLAYPILDTLTLSLSPPIKPALSTAIVLSPTMTCAVRLVSAFAQP
jgi:hypothetical protein